MTCRLTPHLVFLDRAEDALEFYRTVFGGTVTCTRYADVGLVDTADAPRILHGRLEAADLTLVCADTPAGVAHEPGHTVMLGLDGDDLDEMRARFDRLADGGIVTVPLEGEGEDDAVGQVVDRFGVVWVVSVPQAHSVSSAANVPPSS